MLFGSSSGAPHVDDDVDEADTIDFLFGKGKVVVDSKGLLKVLKPEPMELNEQDRRFMYQARVLEGDFSLVPSGPLFWGPLVSFGDGGPNEGLNVEVVDVEEFVEDVAEVLVGDLFEVVVRDMVEEMTVDVCFEEDVVDVWELRRR